MERGIWADEGRVKGRHRLIMVFYLAFAVATVALAALVMLEPERMDACRQTSGSFGKDKDAQPGVCGKQN